MIIRSISGSILLKTSQKSIRATLEYAALHGIDLATADLRGVKLSCAALDGLKAKDACFWGADLSGTDMGLADLRGADLRRADLADTCLAESDLTGADARGAYFSRTIIEGAILDNLKVSCPSFWGSDLVSAKSLKSLCYSHRGETEVVMDQPPIIISGLGRRLVLMGHACLWGNELLWDRSRNATASIPKIMTDATMI